MCIMNRCHMVDKLWLYILPNIVLELEVARKKKHAPSEQQPGGTLTSTAGGFVGF